MLQSKFHGESSLSFIGVSQNTTSLGDEKHHISWDRNCIKINLLVSLTSYSQDKNHKKVTKRSPKMPFFPNPLSLEAMDKRGGTSAHWAATSRLMSFLQLAKRWNFKKQGGWSLETGGVRCWHLNWSKLMRGFHCCINIILWPNLPRRFGGFPGWRKWMPPFTPFAPLVDMKGKVVVS